MASPGKKQFPLRIDPEVWAEVEKLAAPLAKNGYGQYLLSLATRGVVR